MSLELIIIILLFTLAIADLIIGVSNDAVNFLNSAIGSKAAPYRVILLTAMAGIILGSTFSSGLMEIARKGIFNPQFFTFDKILWVFLAVMLTDIILLDIFNTLGLPTSTTVSIIFELLGAATVVGILISYDKNETIGEIFKYINFDSVSNIVLGIFLSILIAFTSGVVFQYILRYLFTFEYKKKLAQVGPLFAGFGITAIIYFLLIKGLKSTSIIPESVHIWVDQNTYMTLFILFVSFSSLFYLLHNRFNTNPLRIVVLAGTFSLAMAFAGNDLVNFIGVPITGFMAFQEWVASGTAAGDFGLGFLAEEDVVVPNYMLLIAGLIMAGTIWLSSKAKNVTETELSLSAQDESDEKFKANAVSRSIVKTSILLGDLFSIFLPKRMYRKYNLSFQKNKMRQATSDIQEGAAFDLVRASSNLVIASILIAWATSMKLPLSTTYVTFMVAMGSSLADKAWGRDSAVYRVAGVLSVIGGWFITAIIAFVVAAFFAFILYKGEVTGMIILVVVLLVYLYFSQKKFTQKSRKDKAQKKKLQLLEGTDADLYVKNKQMIITALKDVRTQYNATLIGFVAQDKYSLRNATQRTKELVNYAYKLRQRSVRNIRDLKQNDKALSELMLNAADLLQDMMTSTQYLAEEFTNYIQNLHDVPPPEFFESTKEMKLKMDGFFDKVINMLEHLDEINLQELRIARNELREFINDELEAQLHIIQKHKIQSKQALLQTNLFLQSRDIQAVLLRISKLFRKYEEHTTLLENSKANIISLKDDDEY